MGEVAIFLHAILWEKEEYQRVNYPTFTWSNRSSHATSPAICLAVSDENRALYKTGDTSAMQNKKQSSMLLFWIALSLHYL